MSTMLSLLNWGALQEVGASCNFRGRDESQPCVRESFQGVLSGPQGLQVVPLPPCILQLTDELSTHLLTQDKKAPAWRWCSMPVARGPPPQASLCEPSHAVCSSEGPLAPLEPRLPLPSATDCRRLLPVCPPCSPIKSRPALAWPNQPASLLSSGPSTPSPGRSEPLPSLSSFGGHPSALGYPKKFSYVS